ncbi:MAG TPA: ABC transporter substrate-binding protein [Iamia sp.]|nr:ABC transporter substrate-binding protein [Iamia sp.]
MTRITRSTAALVLVLALVAGCGGKADRFGGGRGGGGDTDAVASPVRGGTLTYGLDAETGGGWCLPESQLAGSGITVARAIYDTLTMPDRDGGYVPFLAEAVEPSDDFTEWTITVRDGVTFHDGSALTAEVVKNNLDAYRGAPGDHARSPLLTIFVFANIAGVEVTGERELVVTTEVPWPAFPAFLYSAGRLGMMAQAQLDDTESCATGLIGTGPFVLDEWVQGRELRARRNPHYWQIAPDGEAYPYLDEIVFEPIVEAEQRTNALLADDIQMGRFFTAADRIQLREEGEAGTLAVFETESESLKGFWQLNVSKPPLDDVRIRRAMALAIDREEHRDTLDQGEFTDANGPFGPESPAYLEDTGYPMEQDRDEARRLVAEYEAEVGPIRTIRYQHWPEPAQQEQAVFFQQSMAEIGIEITIETVQQDALIDAAVAGDYDMMSFANYPSGDPDELTVWFTGQSPVNFARFDDAEVDRLLAAGRVETDPDARGAIYQDLNRRLGEQAYMLWHTFMTPFVASSTVVHGYDPETAAGLPDGQHPNEAAALSATYGLWRTDAG